ncbi:aconitase X [Rhodovibrionaceae bacterium A322]
MELTAQEQSLLAGDAGEGMALALRVVTGTARLMGAQRLIPVQSAHIDGVIYHGDAGVHFAEKLVSLGAKVSVPATTNVGALDLLCPGTIRLDARKKDMARRMMLAHEDLGCQSSWTCAPYQAGHRPQQGTDVAWGESNAVVFTNSVLGARTNRYGDYLDLCCAISGRAPAYGLHLQENRHATLLIDTSALPDRLKQQEVFYPVLGSWFGRAVGTDIGVITGLPKDLPEDWLKAFGAASASSGAVALFHMAGITPEAPSAEAALNHQPPAMILKPTLEDLRDARDHLSTAKTKASIETPVDAIAVGSPHFSFDECKRLLALFAGRKSAIDFFICTGRHTLQALEDAGLLAPLKDTGVTLVADTCVVVTPILKGFKGLLMTNSGKFAHYGPANTGYDSLFGSLEDCVETAVVGQLRRDEGCWQ